MDGRGARRSSSPVEHFNGFMMEQYTPWGTCHGATWNVLVPPGATLRAHSVLKSAPNCDGQQAFVELTREADDDPAP
jgi:hypothetical protein